MALFDRRELLALIPVALVAGSRVSAQAPLVEVTKDPGCGCCEQWVAHLQKAGFKATVRESADIDALKDKLRIPKAARSCHTGVVAGYAIEGHVPAADLKRLLAEKPAVLGIAVPGMPVGSPGMEVSSGRVQPFDT